MAQTAMEQMYDELMQHEYTIPLELIVRCKELIEVEKEQIINSFKHAQVLKVIEDETRAEQYYNETYKSE